MFQEDFVLTDGIISSFFAIIAVFSFFILFTPLLSPLGRVVYDGTGRSRREVALNAPVSNKDLLYGNLISNLVFFLPFFSFLGTLAFSPFIGTGFYSPIITSLLLFLILSILIVIGLVTGTLMSPLIFNLIKSQKNTYIRAIVTLGISAMVIVSLPLLQFYLNNVSSSGSSLGILSFLPFTATAVLIVFILYGIQIIYSPMISLLILMVYVILIFIVGYLIADTLYRVNDETSSEVYSYPHNRVNRLIGLITRLVPNSIRSITQATIKASLRDIEHLSRISLGISITVFMAFALSGRGLFQSQASLPREFELVIFIFVLTVSSASVLFIEASSFVVQHRDMFSLIKSSPSGSKKFIISKALQMFFILVPVFISVIIGLSFTNIISSSNLIPLISIFLVFIILLISFSLLIYMINPADNDEDLSNFVNLIVFYAVIFFLSTIPMIILFSEFQIRIWHLVLAIILSLVMTFFSLVLSIKLLDDMDLETLDSPISRSIQQTFKVCLLFIAGWLMIPSISITVIVGGGGLFEVILLNSILTLILPFFYYLRRFKEVKNQFHFKKRYISDGFKTLIFMLILGFLIVSIYQLFSGELGPTLISLDLSKFIILLILGVITEEIFFRGFLLSLAKVKLKEDYAVILTSLIFGIIHLLTWASILNGFFQGILLAKLRLKTSIPTTIFTHLIYNIVILLTFNI